MKRLLVFILCIGLMSGVSAQKFFRGGGFYGPRVVVGFNPYWGFGYPYYGYPYNGYPGYGRGSYKLQQQEDNIRYDYQQKIDSTRADKTIRGKARRQKIRDLKHQRNQAIYDAENDFYNRRYQRYQ